MKKPNYVHSVELQDRWLKSRFDDRSGNFYDGKYVFAGFVPKMVDFAKGRDDWFDLDKYKQAAGVAYDFSKKKMEDAGEQDRKTIGEKGTQQRTSARQEQEFRQKDEERDYPTGFQE